MIYTLLVCTIVIGILLCCFKLEIMNRRYITSNAENLLKIDPFEEHRVFLLQKLNKYIVENITDISDDSIDVLLLNLNDNQIFYENSFAKYDSEKRQICLVINTKDGLYSEEYYTYKVVQDKENKVVFLRVKNKI